VYIQKCPIFKAIYQKNFLSYITLYLNLNNEKLSNQILLCLGNIIPEDLLFRDIIINDIFLTEKLTSMAKDINNNIALIKNLIFVFRNLSRGNPKPPSQRVI